jgi:peptidyl-prolyl cis-trans isomerase SurA
MTMKNGLTGILAGTAAMFLLAGCSNKIPQGKFTAEQMKTIPFPPRYDLPVPEGGMALNVESETITTKEMVLRLEQQLKPVAMQGNEAAFRRAAQPAFREVLRSRITDILLYKEAKKKAPENIDDPLDKAVESELSRFLASYGNNRILADNALRTMGYDWKSYRDFERKLILTQSYLSKEFTDKRPVSHGEMLDYYNRHHDQFCMDGTIQFRVIEIIPEKLLSDMVRPGEAAEAAAVRLSVEVMDKIKGGADFGKLAEQYSQGPLAAQGGLWRPVTPGSGSLPAPYDILEQKAMAMEPGQAVGPFPVDGRLLILKLESKKEAQCKSFEDVQDAIEQQFQFEFRKQQYEKVVEKLTACVDVARMDDFIDHCMTDAYAMWNPK